MYCDLFYKLSTHSISFRHITDNDRIFDFVTMHSSTPSAYMTRHHLASANGEATKSIERCTLSIDLIFAWRKLKGCHSIVHAIEWLEEFYWDNVLSLLGIGTITHQRKCLYISKSGCPISQKYSKNHSLKCMNR